MTTAVDPIAFTFEPKHHVYRLGGRILPSITQILKELGFYTEFSMDPVALRRGTWVHKFCQFYDENDLDWSQVPDEHLGYVMAWEKFVNQSGFTWTEIEKPKYHPVFLFAGTADREGVMPDGTKWIVEIKTGSVAPATAIQTAAQELLCQESRKRMAVELHEDGTWRPEYFKERGDTNQFLSLLSAHNWRISHNIKSKEKPCP